MKDRLNLVRYGGVEGYSDLMRSKNMKGIFLLTIIFCTNYLFANHPLLEKANDGPRWAKQQQLSIAGRQEKMQTFLMER